MCMMLRDDALQAKVCTARAEKRTEENSVRRPPTIVGSPSGLRVSPSLSRSDALRGYDSLLDALRGYDSLLDALRDYVSELYGFIRIL